MKEPVGYHETAAAIGSLFLLWSRVERQVGSGIEFLASGHGIAKPHGVWAKIGLWRELQRDASRSRGEHEALLEEVVSRLKGALELRNRVAHGLLGVSASDSAGEGAGLTVEVGDGEHFYSYMEIQKQLQILWHSGAAIDDLSLAAVETNAKRAATIYAAVRENRLP